LLGISAPILDYTAVSLTPPTFGVNPLFTLAYALNAPAFWLSLTFTTSHWLINYGLLFSAATIQWLWLPQWIAALRDIQGKSRLFLFASLFGVLWLTWPRVAARLTVEYWHDLTSDRMWSSGYYSRGSTSIITALWAAFLFLSALFLLVPLTRQVFVHKSRNAT
jgi:hypothetical protein